MRLRVLELSRSRKEVYAEINVEDSGRSFKLVLNIEHKSRGGFSVVQVHCECDEFKSKGICRHVLKALSSIAGVTTESTLLST